MTAQDTATFETPSLIVNCFGEKAAINDLVAFFELHSEGGRAVNVPTLVDRAIMHGTQAFVESKGWRTRKIAQALNEELLDKDLLLNEKEYCMMRFFWNRDLFAEALGMTDEKADELMRFIKDTYYPDEDFDWHDM